MRFPWSGKSSADKSSADYESNLADAFAVGDPAIATRARDAFSAAVKNAPRIAVIGQAGVGKSLTIVKLFNLSPSALIVSDVLRGTNQPIETDVVTPRGHITIIDMPGLGETEDVDKVMLPYYAQVLPTVDVALWVLRADRNQAPSQAYLNRIREMLAPGVFNRIVLGLNKVDLMMPGKWIERANWPDSTMRASIAELRQWVKDVFAVDNSRVVAYSAYKQYNLDGLRNAMLAAVPPTRILALDKRADPATALSGMSKENREKAKKLLEEVGL